VPSSEANALNTMLYSRGLHVSMVTPDYPKKESIHIQDPCTNEESLCVTKKVISMTKGTFFPREQPSLASLAPRPGKIIKHVLAYHNLLYVFHRSQSNQVLGYLVHLLRFL
jgi:hypothetical protein